MKVADPSPDIWSLVSPDMGEFYIIYCMIKYILYQIELLYFMLVVH